MITKSLEVKQVLFSKKNLRSILYNLIANGIKFANGSTPLIHIAIIRNNDNIVLSVTDNGIGIAKNQVDIIFSMYGRLNKELEGQGIGLYLAKKIIDAANGSISVKSEMGKGSTFYICLPIPVMTAD
ncbi:sensor histidine kinase [Mucilaginibacter psychrotolerans]|uniref:sensor histidine kinase n=1 Tax=Mucilaginibacter psychrotolerans TaxID=1524096 RepID=UPI0013051489|nr:ATP-binding protein [Mucilaginibacter psychrotolerans]